MNTVAWIAVGASVFVGLIVLGVGVGTYLNAHPPQPHSDVAIRRGPVDEDDMVTTEWLLERMRNDCDE